MRDMTRFAGLERFLEIALYLVTAGMIFLFMFDRFRFEGTGYLAFYEDDFYYYLQIARNIHSHGFSSFNGLHPTNGYNPLWMAFIVGALAAWGEAGPPFFITISSLVVLSNIFIFIFVRRLFLRFIDNRLLATALSSFASYLSMMISFGAMEVHLTVLMSVILVYYLIVTIDHLDRKRTMLFLGFLSSLLVLSRLDSFLFVLLILLALPTISCRSFTQYLRRLMFFGAGGLLLPLYLASNVVIFGTLMPISGMAKQLKTTFHFSTQYLVTMYALLKANFFSTMFIVPSVSMTVAGAVAAMSDYKKHPDKNILKILLACLVFPFLFLLMHSILSDFGIWAWYLYPLVLSFVAASIVLYGALKSFLARRMSIYALASACMGIVFIIGVSARFRSSSSPVASVIYASSLKIAESLRHDRVSVVGIGDRAGLVSFLIDNPVIQLEGLVMDRNYLRRIENEDDLVDVLKSYGVKYYVTHHYTVDDASCYHVFEPAQGGAGTRKMRGKLCGFPVEELSVINQKIAIFRIVE